jgi:hypothetical protein
MREVSMGIVTRIRVADAYYARDVVCDEGSEGLA